MTSQAVRLKTDGPFPQFSAHIYWLFCGFISSRANKQQTNKKPNTYGEEGYKDLIIKEENILH